MSNVRRQKMRNAQPSASSALRCHRIHAWSAPKQLKQFSQEVGPSLALTGLARGSRTASSARHLRVVFCASLSSVCFSARTFPLPPCPLAAPGGSRQLGVLLGFESNASSLTPARVRYSGLRHPAARFRTCQPPNPSIERDVQELSLLAAPHVTR